MNKVFHQNDARPQTIKDSKLFNKGQLYDLTLYILKSIKQNGFFTTKCLQKVSHLSCFVIRATEEIPQRLNNKLSRLNKF